MPLRTRVANVGPTVVSDVTRDNRRRTDDAACPPIVAGTIVIFPFGMSYTCVACKVLGFTHSYIVYHFMHRNLEQLFCLEG